MKVELKNNLPQIKERLRAAFGDLARETAEAIRDDASANAPVDKGELRDSYHVTQIDDNKFVVGSTAEHAPHVEYGTSKAAAQPHLTPAAENARAQIAEIARDVLR